MKLKQFRQQKGMTQEAVADYLGIPKKTYQNYEREVREADSDVLCSLADLYGASLDDLVGRDLSPDAETKGGSERSASMEELTALYEEMNEDGREALLIIARGLAQAFGK